MATTVTKILNQAKTWIGKNENDNSFRVIIDTYNAHKPLARAYKVKYTDEWCATFISALAVKCGATDIIPTECSCQKMIELFKGLGVWVEDENRTPKAGDIIFYDWQDDGRGDNKGWADHVGIVETVTPGGAITIIEGNISRKVGRRTLHVNGKYIRGYATPKYTKTTKSITTIAKEVIDGKWGVGEARKKALTNAGYDYDKVQAKVNEMLKKPNTTAIKKTITIGSKVKVANDAVIGGLASNRGKKVSSYLKSKTWIVADIETHNNVKEARLKGAETWVAVKYLTVI